MWASLLGLEKMVVEGVECDAFEVILVIVVSAGAGRRGLRASHARVSAARLGVMLLRGWGGGVVHRHTILSVGAAATYDYLRQRLRRYETATPDTIWRRFTSTSGQITIAPDGVTCPPEA